MKVKIDRQYNLAYIQLVDEIGEGVAKRTIVIGPPTLPVAVDLDGDNHVIGIEIFDLKYLHPDLVKLADSEGVEPL